MVALVTGVTDPNTSETTLDVAWRRMAGRDGIVGDFDGGAFAMTLSPVSPTLTVAALNRSVLVDGNLVTFDANAVLDPRDVGDVPTGSQVRRDYLVARYDSAVAVLRNRGSLAILPGERALPAIAQLPTTVPRTRAGTTGKYDVLLGSYVLPAAGLLNSGRSLRSWTGPEFYLPDGEDPVGLYPLGSTRLADTFRQKRILVPAPPAGVVPGWRLERGDLPEVAIDESAGGWNPAGSYAEVRAGSVHADINTVRTGASFPVSGQAHTILRMPEGYRPGRARHVQLKVGSGAVFDGLVQPDGLLVMQPFGIDNGRRLQASLTYPQR